MPYTETEKIKAMPKQERMSDYLYEQQKKQQRKAAVQWRKQRQQKKDRFQEAE